MANFSTHLGVSTVASGLLSSLCLQAGVVDLVHVLPLFFVGAISGILPDIDSDHSKSMLWLFRLIGVCLGVCCFVFLQSQLPLLWLWLIVLIVYFLVCMPLRILFAKFTEHRGLYHSLLANSVFSLLVCVLTYFFNLQAKLAWLLAVFTFFGATLHLLLDELYAVDLSNQRIKRSFGSALKLWDYQEPINSLVMLGVLLILGYIAPPLPDIGHIIEQLLTVSWWVK